VRMSGRMGLQFAGAVLSGLACLLALSGCTAESVRIALETQRRADEVQQAVFERQHEALQILLYHELVNRLEAGGVALTEAQRADVSAAWNERDLLEFWAVQQERSRALRLIGVDAKLASDQSIVDLLVKSVEARFDRASEAVAGIAGEHAVAGATATQPPADQAGGAGQ
jgi:hypothetical protein